MGTQGVKFTPKKSTIIAALKKHKGKVTFACKDLSCHHNTLKKYIDNNPELIELLAALRHEYNDTLLDSAEDTLLFAISKRNDDLGNALKSSFYILNNKGKERGYSGQVGSSAAGNSEDIRDFIASHPLAAAQISAACQPGRSLLENEQPLLHQGQGREENPIQDELGAAGAMERSPSSQDSSQG